MIDLPYGCPEFLYVLYDTNKLRIVREEETGDIYTTDDYGYISHLAARFNNEEGAERFKIITYTY